MFNKIKNFFRRLFGRKIVNTVTDVVEDSFKTVEKEYLDAKTGATEELSARGVEKPKRRPRKPKA
jgi:hypothetical protein